MQSGDFFLDFGCVEALVDAFRWKIRTGFQKVMSRSVPLPHVHIKFEAAVNVTKCPPPPADDIKPCPRCGAYIIKMNDGSCNHMTCAVCGCEFCWLCMKEISDLHYLRYWQLLFRPLRRLCARPFKTCDWKTNSIPLCLPPSPSVHLAVPSGGRSLGAGRRRFCGSWAPWSERRSASPSSQASPFPPWSSASLFTSVAR